MPDLTFEIFQTLQPALINKRSMTSASLPLRPPVLNFQHLLVSKSSSPSPSLPMFRTRLSSLVYSQPWLETWLRFLIPFTLLITVFVTLRFGYYPNRNLVLGPSASCLVKSSSIFIERIQVRDEGKKGTLVLYGFSEKPKLRSEETNWNASKHLLLGAHRPKGVTLWLNKGSRIGINWIVETSVFDHLSVALIKGEHNHMKLEPSPNSHVIGNQSHGTGKAEYLIEEDDSYLISVENTNPKNRVMIVLNINVSSRIYNTSKATSKCLATERFCELMLLFPRPHYLILTTPNNGHIDGLFIVKLSFLAHLPTYIIILGIVAGFVFLILKYLKFCKEREASVEAAVTASDPLLMPKEGKNVAFNYGTNEEDSGSGMLSSSEDLYDGKMCVICFDEQRNCFFVPCGHYATCCQCAQRIVEGSDKVCPMCRRIIHKVRRLFIA